MIALIVSDSQDSYDSMQALKEVQLAGLRTVVEREKAGIIITLYGFFI